MYSNDEKIRKTEERLKETEKVFGYVFDKFTLLNIYKMFSGKYIERFEFPISSGKESIVFAASGEGKFYAVKIYKTVASTFKNIERYAGDRWGIENSSNKRKFVVQWAYREFRNLGIANQAGVFAPKPIKVIGNVLLMQYLGTRRRPAPQIKDIEIDDSLMKQIFGDIRNLYLKGKLVHGDLSEYNFLLHRKKAYMIDIAQALDIKDPASMILLKRDVNNMVKFFNKFGFDIDENKILRYTVGEINDFD
ncbi:MAG: serine protein kinase RIO [Thermoplasmata archaeon]